MKIEIDNGEIYKINWGDKEIDIAGGGQFIPVMIKERSGKEFTLILTREEGYEIMLALQAILTGIQPHVTAEVIEHEPPPSFYC